MSTKRKVLQSIYALVVLGCSIGIFRSSVTEAEFTIKAAIQASNQDEDFIGLLAFKDYVENASDGRVQVQLYSSGQFCGGVAECVGNLQKGVLEIFPTTAGGAGNFFAQAQVLDLPYMFDTDEQVECVLAGPILQKMRDAVLAQNLNLRLMGFSNTGGWRNFATTSAPIQHPRDLLGKKIRTTEASIQQEFVRQLGANPTPVSWAETYTALATGVVEGSKNGIQDIIGAKLEEHLKYIVLDRHSYMATMWWFSEPKWQSLPDGIQQILVDGFKRQRAAANNFVAQQENNSFELFEKAGGVIYRPSTAEKLAFKQASVNMRQWFIQNYGDQWLTLVESSAAQCSGH